MKHILLILGMVYAVGCSDPNEPSPTRELSEDSQRYSTHVTTYTYEGCQYIVVGYGQDCWGSHKGNCNNPIHNQNK